MSYAELLFHVFCPTSGRVLAETNFFNVSSFTALSGYLRGGVSEWRRRWWRWWWW